MSASGISFLHDVSDLDFLRVLSGFRRGFS